MKRLSNVSLVSRLCIAIALFLWAVTFPGREAAAAPPKRIEGKNAVAKVDFGSAGVKRLLLRFAPIAKL